MFGKFKTGIHLSADLQASPHIYLGEAAADLAFLPLGKALCREKRYPRIAAFPIGEGGPRQWRSGALVNDALETIFFALFHTARTLSGSLCSPPSPRGEGFVRRYSFSPRILYSL